MIPANKAIYATPQSWTSQETLLYPRLPGSFVS